ncbi:MAG: EAL domain-containing protein [Christensenellaceae bacterium]|nr:EAL domain-containing protein [Christensenellaceae bacterium]
MKHDIALSMIYYICGCFYTFFGLYIFARNPKSYINRLFLLITFSMAAWSFAYSFSTSEPTAEARAFWTSFSVFGWGAFYSFFLHFVLILTKSRLQLNTPGKTIVFYLPSLISMILFAPHGFFADVQYELIPCDTGLRDFFSQNIGPIWIILYYTIFSVPAFILLFRWWKKIEPHTPLKRSVTHFLISIIGPFLAGSVTDAFSDVLGLNQIPRLAIVFLIFPTIFMFITLRKFGLILERRKARFIPNDAENILENRLRLFQTAAAMFTIGAAGSFFVEYYIGGKNFSDEFLLAVVVWILGVFLLIIPYVVKKQTTQNNLFLITSILGMTFFLVQEMDIGATTVWAVYIVFLLFSIVLDSRVHTLIFLVYVLITQVVLWIFFPEVSVIIDIVQYLKRIFIIALTYYAVKYLTDEYASKLIGYQRFSKKQEMLEKISTSFVSVNNDNLKEKVDEMLKMSAEILNFDSAYLFEFDADYKNATINNMYVKDNDSKLTKFYPGMKFKTADFPEIQPLIARNSPLLSEDVTSISVDEAGYQRNFFLSRGIKSFFAFPIIVDNNTDGFFVIEYENLIDKRFTESRLNYMQIITNILGDTKKKGIYEERLYNFAYFDESTKLANRNMLKKALAELIYNRKESEKLVIFNAEIDNLRMINDTFGHNVGEQIVIESASMLKKLMKDGCDLSRVGKGKFIIVMPFAETSEQIEECANKIVDAFSNPILPKGEIEALFVNVNVGVAVYPDDGRDADTLLKNADLAGYEAKSSNNKIVFYSEQLKSRAEENASLTNRLFHALQNKEFFLEFQPQISCYTGKTSGIEALLRWTVDGRRIPPDRFIPILEQTGLIYDVGLWVLENALQEHIRLIERGFQPLRVSVNLSVVQFQGESFIDDVRKIIEESEVDPKYIELEITESLFSKDPKDVLKKLYELKELGVRIAIDDFGKGYSSLNRLKLVPFDRIKIDKEIIDYINLDEKKAPITQISILLARTFKADVTAEGVETMEQANFLRSIDCDEIQGYYYSRPLSVEALEEFLENERYKHGLDN